MSTIEDLQQASFSEMSTDEALELLRQIRLSRRITKKSPKKKSTTTKVKKTKKLSKVEAKKLLELLGG